MSKAIIVSAPSGAGKTTLVRHIVDNMPQVVFSISSCTRERRSYEQDGVDYYFMSILSFQQRVKKQEFIEWEEVYPNHFYGTLKEEIEKIWQSGKSVIFDVDVVGGLNLKKYFGDDAIAVFVKPPSVESLVERLSNRKTETPDTLQTRINKGIKELEFESSYDVIVLNEDLEHAKQEILQIVTNFLEYDAVVL